MKSLIMYEYGLKNPIIKLNDKFTYIYNDQKKYILKEIISDENILCKTQHERYYKLIKNKDNKYISKINGKDCILFEVTRNEQNIEKLIKNKSVKEYKVNDWGKKWEEKLLLLEKNKDKIKDVNLIEYYDYYIGMLKNAITCFRYNKEASETGKIVICHKRLSRNEILHPDNSIEDYIEREIAEYIKYLFFELNFTEDRILIILGNLLKEEKYNLSRLIARMLLPNKYMDMIDDYIINNKINNKKLNNMILKMNSYEELIYKICKNLYKNEMIEWIKKETTYTVVS